MAFVLAVSCCRRGTVTGDLLADENTEADFGVIKEKDGVAGHNLLYVNSTGDTLRPVEALTRCSCVTAHVSRDPVAPGDTLKLSVVYNPSYRKGIFMEEIGVRCLDRKGILSFIIKGEIIPMEHPVEEDYPYDFGNGIHLSHEVLHFGKLLPGERGRMFIRIANTRKHAAVLSFSVPGQFSPALSFRNGISMDADGRDTLWFTFTMPDCLEQGDTVTFPLTIGLDGRMIEKRLLVKAIAPDSESL